MAYPSDAVTIVSQTTPTALERAAELVNGDRGATYGHPAADFQKVVDMAQALWGRGPETPEEHALYMILVKLSRLSVTPWHRDSLVDICGYVRTYEMILDDRDAAVRPSQRDLSE